MSNQAVIFHDVDADQVQDILNDLPFYTTALGEVQQSGDAYVGAGEGTDYVEAVKQLVKQQAGRGVVDVDAIYTAISEAVNEAANEAMGN